jgi:hypothetical protein
MRKVLWKRKVTHEKTPFPCRVKNLSISIGFCRELFNPEPIVMKDDCAKWMPDDSRMNFAIRQRAKPTGVQRLGIQVEDRAEFMELYGRLKGAGGAVIEEGATTGPYAQSEKSWIEDPQGVEWETFATTGQSTTYGADSLKPVKAKPCCPPNRAA